jgi:O-antigen/teichoic acid export membrane protein
VRPDPPTSDPPREIAPALSYRRFAGNVAAGIGSRGAAIVVALALTTVLVRTLGAVDYGTWSFFFVLLGFNGQFDLGLSVALERAVARAAADGQWARLTRLLASGLLLAAGLSVLLQVAILAAPVSWYARVGDHATVRACLLVLPACLLCSNAAAVMGAGLAGLQRTTTLALQRSVIGALAAGAVVALALAGVHRLDALLVAYAAGLALAAAVNGRTVAAAIRGAHAPPIGSGGWRPDGAAVRELMNVGGPLQVATLVAQLGDQALRLVLGSRFGPAAMGTYDLAVRAATAPRSLVAALFVALVPFVAGRERRHGRAVFGEALWVSTKYTALLIVPATIAGVVVARPLFAVWLGPEADRQVEAAALFVVLLVALALQTVSGPMIALGRADGRPAPEAVATLLGQVLAVALAATQPTLVAAVATFVGCLTISQWLLWAYLRRRLAVGAAPGGWLASLGGVSAGTAVVAWLIDMSPIATAAPWMALLVAPAVIAGASGALALAVGAVSTAERQVLRDVVARSAALPRL